LFDARRANPTTTQRSKKPLNSSPLAASISAVPPCRVYLSSLSVTQIDRTGANPVRERERGLLAAAPFGAVLVLAPLPALRRVYIQDADALAVKEGRRQSGT